VVIFASLCLGEFYYFYISNKQKGRGCFPFSPFFKTTQLFRLSFYNFIHFFVDFIFVLNYDFTMFKLSYNHRQLYSEKILDTGNIALGALVFGQFVSQGMFSWGLTILGITVLFICFLISYLLLKGE